MIKAFAMLVAIFYMSIYAGSQFATPSVQKSIKWLDRAVLLSLDDGIDLLARCVFKGDSGVVKVSAYIEQGDTVIMFAEEMLNNGSLLIDYKDSIPLLKKSKSGGLDLSGLRTIRPGFVIVSHDNKIRVKPDCGDSQCGDRFRNRIDSCSQISKLKKLINSSAHVKKDALGHLK